MKFGKALGLMPWLVLAALAGLIGASLAMADDAYLTGPGDGYYPGSGTGQGAYPAAYVNGAGEGYDYYASDRIIYRGSMLSICWLLYVPSPEIAGQAGGQKQMYLAERAIPVDPWRAERHE